VSSYYYLQLITMKKHTKLQRYDPFKCVIELVFYIDLVVNFLVEKEVSGAEKQTVERDIKKIAVIYLKTDFLFDLIMLFPLYEVLYGKFENDEYLLLIRTMRIKNGIKAIDANIYIKMLRRYTMNRVDKMI
jgi:hypothetical protein